VRLLEELLEPEGSGAAVKAASLSNQASAPDAGRLWTPKWK
jgi:hypothetical protein